MTLYEPEILMLPLNAGRRRCRPASCSMPTADVAGDGGADDLHDRRRGARERGAEVGERGDGDRRRRCRRRWWCGPETRAVAHARDRDAPSDERAGGRRRVAGLGGVLRRCRCRWHRSGRRRPGDTGHRGEPVAAVRRRARRPRSNPRRRKRRWPSPHPSGSRTHPYPEPRTHGWAKSVLPCARRLITAVSREVIARRLAASFLFEPERIHPPDQSACGRGHRTAPSRGCCPGCGQASRPVLARRGGAGHRRRGRGRRRLVRPGRRPLPQPRRQRPERYRLVVGGARVAPGQRMDQPIDAAQVVAPLRQQRLARRAPRTPRVRGRVPAIARPSQRARSRSSQRNRSPRRRRSGGIAIPTATDARRDRRRKPPCVDLARAGRGWSRR